MPHRMADGREQTYHSLDGRCANCARFAPDNPSVIATVAGEPVAYLCGSCLPWEEDELFRPFEAGMHERYAGLPLAFAFRPMWAARLRVPESGEPIVSGEHADSRYDGALGKV